MHLPRSHPAVIEFEDGSYGVKDELDSDVGTIHFVVRNPNDGNVIASIRTVDANTSKLDMEKVRKGETEKRGVGRAKREAHEPPQPLANHHNSLRPLQFIFMSLPYVLKVTFWQADYTLAFRVIATQLFRAFCGFFTFLPPSREFLPSYWDYPEAIYCVAGTMDCSIPPDRNNPAPFVTFFSGHVAMVVIIGNHMYTRGFRKSGVAMHVMNMMQVLR